MNTVRHTGIAAICCLIAAASAPRRRVLMLLGLWGPCEGLCGPDIEGDGSVDTTDLLFVLGAWGPC